MNQTPEQAAHRHRPVRVALVGLAGVVAILGAKVAVFYVTNSAAVLSDALESIMNIAATLLALFSVWYAARPPDREHPYGHGKIEFVTAGAEGAMVLLAGLAIAVEAVRRLIVGSELGSLGPGMVAMTLIAAALGGLGYYIREAGQRCDSEVLIADGKHLMTDAISTVGAAAALLVVKLTGLTWFDPAAAVLLCVVIGWTGINIMRRAVSRLLDRIDEQDDAVIRGILDDETAAGAIVSYEKVRLRHQGAYHWIDMHLRFPPDMSVKKAHDEASRIEGRIESAFGGQGRADATAHIEAHQPGQPSEYKANSH